MAEGNLDDNGQIDGTVLHEQELHRLGVCILFRFALRFSSFMRFRVYRFVIDIVFTQIDRLDSARGLSRRASESFPQTKF